MRIVLPLLSALIACGCGPSLSFMRTAQPPREPKPHAGADVEVYLVAPPRRPYVEFGIVESTELFDGENTDAMSDLINSMREYAGGLGCDALVIVGSNDGITAGSGRHGGGSRSYKGYRGSCVMYVEASTLQPPAAPLAAAPK
jgi:hypothetical protein